MTGIPFSLSTAWNYRNHEDAAGMAREITALGFDRIELNFALTGAQVEGFARLAASGSLVISSTHNFCPLPDGVKPKDASPEYYALSSTDEDERKRALHFTKKSMDAAGRLGASALVLHLGRVEIEDRTKELFGMAGSPRFEKAKCAALRERGARSGPYLECAKRSLETLLSYAHTVRVPLALENRYYIKELPSLDEFTLLYGEFDDPYLGYWHDTGHAQVYENLGILKHEEYLEALSNRLIGVHLHDIIIFDDHRAPGTGEFDFRRLRPYLRRDTVKVIEAHRKARAEEIRRSVPFLKEALGV